MARYLPILLGMLLIVGLTIPQIQMTDRLSGTNFSAEQRAALLDKVPKSIGDWHGEDKQTDPNVRRTAGAIGAVSRTYRNSRTGEQVDLWLIVGHARDVSFHTPDVCYPASGFAARASENGLFSMVTPNQPEGAPFLTNTFLKEDLSGQHLVRVFWSWYNPEDKANNDKVVWDAPHNARWHFGNTRALYKMYFTSFMRDPKETADQSACVRFARDFLPAVNKALEEVRSGAPGAETASGPATEPMSTESNAGATATGENPKDDAAAVSPDTGKDGTAEAAKSGAEAAPAPPAATVEKSGGEADSLFAPPTTTK